MDIREFLDLPFEKRQEMVQMHEKQRKIRETTNNIKEQRRKLDIQEMNTQMICDHFFAIKRYEAFENEFGNYTGGGEYHCYCPDCDRRWREPK